MDLFVQNDTDSRHTSDACIDFFYVFRDILSTILDFFTMSAIFIIGQA